MSDDCSLDLNFIVKLNISRFSSETGPRPSYFHRLGKEPLKYLNVGQVFKQTAVKHPDRLALVSCTENSRLTFEETLDKVIENSEPEIEARLTSPI